MLTLITQYYKFKMIFGLSPQLFTILIKTTDRLLNDIYSDSLYIYTHIYIYIYYFGEITRILNMVNRYVLAA